MKIYTKTGDTGETGLFGGARVRKNVRRIESYGTVDELNAILGITRSTNTHAKIDSVLHSLQNDLFIVGADLATPAGQKTTIIPRIQSDDVRRLEKFIDEIDAKLKPLTSFILPGGSVTAAQLHLARTVCRRAERMVVGLAEEENIGNTLIVYLNRLSDLLFVLARYANVLDGNTEQEWTSGKRTVKKKRGSHPKH